MTEEKRKSLGKFVPFAIALFMLVGLAPNFALVYLATNDPSFGVEENYYEKALAWDERMAQERRNAELGWELELELSALDLERGERELSLVLRDRQGAPKRGCEVSVETFALARSAKVVRASLEERSEGVHGASLPLVRPGLWELRFDASCKGERYTATLERELDGSLR